MIKKYKNKKIRLILFSLAASLVLLGVCSYRKAQNQKIVYADSMELNLLDDSQPNSVENPYIINGVEDMLFLQEFSKYNTCEGMYFSVSYTLRNVAENDMLNFNPDGYSDDEDDEDDGSEIQKGINYHIDLVTPNDALLSDNSSVRSKVWYGIGMNFAYPFKGNIDFGGIKIKTDTNLFGFISDGAVVQEVRVFGEINANKNKSYYKATDIPIAAIASIAYIRDPNGEGKSVTVKNCTVYNGYDIASAAAASRYRTTITNSTKCSSAGIIASCVAMNNKFGDGTKNKEKDCIPVNFNISTCIVDADIKTVGRSNSQHINYDLGAGSSNGVDRNGNFNPKNVTNSNILVNSAGFAAGLIGDIQSKYSYYYCNVNISGNNQVKGNITATASAAGGAVGYISSRVDLRFSGSLIFATESSKLESLSSYNSSTIACRSGLYLASGMYSSLSIDKDFNFVNSSAVKSVAVSGNGYFGDNVNDCPLNVYNGIDLSQNAALRGKGTKENPYILHNANDFKILARYIGSNGYFGEEFFDITEKTDNKLSAFDYIRTAYFEIENDIDLTDSGINTIGRAVNYICFSGVLYGMKQSDGSYPVLTNNIDSTQDYTSLFAFVTPRKGYKCEIRDFVYKGDMKSRGRVCGLIYDLRIYDTTTDRCGSFSMSNIDNQVNLSVNTNYDSCYSSPYVGRLYLTGYNRTDYTNEEVRDPISFKKLKYSGNMNARGGNWGGLIAYINNLNYSKYGNTATIDIEDFTFNGNIIGLVGSNYYYYGGLISNINNVGGETISVFDNAADYGCVDLRAGFYGEKLNINLKNYSATDAQISSAQAGGTLGGFLGYNWAFVNAVIDGVKIKDCYAERHYTTYGGAITMTNNSVYDIKNVDYDGFVIHERTYMNGDTGGFFGTTNLTTIVNFDASTFSVKNCGFKNNPRYCSDIVGDTGNYISNGTYYYSDLQSIINIYGNDENGDPYSVNNPYINRFSYIANNGTVSENYDFVSNGAYVYNTFPDTISDKYKISGTGTDSDPFIIDTPEKMVILDEFLMIYATERYNFFKYFDDSFQVKYFEAGSQINNQKVEILRKILIGTYVFTDNINLSDYSFHALRAEGGKYYGINAKKYLVDVEHKNIDDITSADIKRVCVEAIRVLSKDKEYTDKYEEAFEASFISRGGLSAFPNPNTTNKSAIEEGIAESILNNYNKLKTFKKYKPEISFDANSIQNSTKAQNKVCVRPVSNYLINDNNRIARQSRDLHSGLFANIAKSNAKRAISVNNLKLQGSFSGLTYSGNGDAGALFARTRNYDSITDSTVDIKNIDLGNVSFIKSYTAGPTTVRGTGLLIQAISNSDVNIDGITVLGGSNVAGADALIGYQSGMKSKCIFRHIDINEIIDSLARGLFYFNYYEGLAIYYYLDGDYENKTINADVITPGIVNIDGEKKVITTITKPYAYKDNAVDINPVIKNIEHGSGTKEDPYLIEDVSQLLSLYIAIKNYGSVAGKDEWFVGERNNLENYDPSDSTTWGNENDVTWDKSNDNEDVRMTKLEHLRSAYYAIASDLDIRNVTNMFKTIAGDFRGLGTVSYPFSGSLNGAYRVEGTDEERTKRAVYDKNVTHTIEMNGDKTLVVQNYGLVQYADGVEIKNLNLVNDETFRLRSASGTNFGLAVGTITGGDTVIENVTSKCNIYSESFNQSYMSLAGLVGNIRYGTVTFKNIDNDAIDVKAWTYGLVDRANNIYGYTEYTNSAISTYIAGYVGKIDPEYSLVFVDKDNVDMSDKDSKYYYADLKTDNDWYTVKNNIRMLRNIDSYFVVNKDYFNSVADDKIVVDGSTDDGYVCHIKNEKQMYLLSLAFTSGSVSANTSSKTLVDNAGTAIFSYKYYSRTYKDNDNDNSNYYPAMLHYYFDLSRVKGNADTIGGIGSQGITALMYKYSGGALSMLNTFSSVTAKKVTRHTKELADGTQYTSSAYRTTYILEEKDIFDMTTEPDFIGFGTRSKYNWQRGENSFYSDFDGNNKTVKIVFNEKSEDKGVGLFNSITDNYFIANDEHAFQIRNIKLTGSITIEGRNNGDYASLWNASAAGALIGFFNTRTLYDILNITVEDFSFETTSKITEKKQASVGGIIGVSVYTSNSNIGSKADNEYQWNNRALKIRDALVKNVSVKSNYCINKVGGIIGHTLQCDIKDSVVDGLNITGSRNTSTEATYDGNGGVIGQLRVISAFNYIDNVTVKNSNITTYAGNAGGLIGRLLKELNASTFKPTLSVRNITLEENNVKVTFINKNDNYEGVIIAKLANGKEYHDVGILNPVINYSDNSTVHKPANLWNNTNSTSSPNLKSEIFFTNDFQDIEAAEEKYGIVGGIKYPDDNTVLNYAEIISKDEYAFKDENGDGVDLVPESVAPGNTKKDKLLVEWSTSSGTMINVINSILGTLTDGTGRLNTTENKYATGNTNDNITIEIIPMEVDNGVARVRTDGSAALVVKKNSDGNFEFSNNNIYDRYEKIDSSGNHITGTYSIIKITYNVSTVASNMPGFTNVYNENRGYSDTIYIPFMVNKMVNAEVYRRIIHGENYDTDVLHNLTELSIKLTKDSSYTLYEEFLYSLNRQDFVDEDIYYVKEFILNSDRPVIPKGTRLTMVDMANGKNEVYYYTVNDSAVTSVRLTDFADENGNHYKERNIAKFTELANTSSYSPMKLNTGRVVTKRNRGIEKYIIFVDNTDILDKTVDESVSEGGIITRESTWQPAIVDAEGFKEDYLNEMIEANTRPDGTHREILTTDIFHTIEKCKTELKTYDGRNIGFVEDSVTSGDCINTTTTLEASISFYNQATRAYWEFINDVEGSRLNDYSNSNKFLEVAISLVNEEGDRILFPEGTRVRMNGASDYEGIRNTSNVYYYKDSTLTGYRLMDVTSDRQDTINISFDFSYAKMENLPAGTYKLSFELLRAKDKDYPMGSETLDTAFSGPIEVADYTEYGFSLSEYDKSKLTYNKKTDGEETVIDYKVKLNSSFDQDKADNKEVCIISELTKKTSLGYTSNDLTGVVMELDINALSQTGYKIVKDGNVIYDGDKGTIDISDIKKILIKGIPGKENGVNNKEIEIAFKITITSEASANNYKINSRLYSDYQMDKLESEDYFKINVSDIQVI